MEEACEQLTLSFCSSSSVSVILWVLRTSAINLSNSCLLRKKILLADKINKSPEIQLHSLLSKSIRGKQWSVSIILRNQSKHTNVTLFSITNSYTADDFAISQRSVPALSSFRLYIIMHETLNSLSMNIFWLTFQLQVSCQCQGWPSYWSSRFGIYSTMSPC